jgi:hypothetical protein
MNVLSYAHPQLFKVFKHLIYVWDRCGMQFERFTASMIAQCDHFHTYII